MKRNPHRQYNSERLNNRELTRFGIILGFFWGLVFLMTIFINYNSWLKRLFWTIFEP